MTRCCGSTEPCGRYQELVGGPCSRAHPGSDGLCSECGKADLIAGDMLSIEDKSPVLLERGSGSGRSIVIKRALSFG